MNSPAIKLRVLLPSGPFLELGEIVKVVAETRRGLFGILPQRLDCAAALVPGILSYQRRGEDDVFVAVDEGVLVKTGLEVVVAVRQATSGVVLGGLREAVADSDRRGRDEEREVRTALSKLESHFVRQLMRFGHEREP